ncbi:MAG: NAD-dependent protein deacylase [Lachnospiraceae bacterium]|nr:NAD-dependent protein deacylase [Lachnospiraceae bacterium]
MSEIQGFEQLKKYIEESDNIVFFGGAGVSTESGVPDFRSVDGLYHQHFKYPPETMLSHSFYVHHKKDFYDFYRQKLLAPNNGPNAAHKKLAQWEQEGKLKAVITQNIDGLHQAAGSKNVLELHGSVLRNYCESCHEFYDLDYVADMKNADKDGIPVCKKCGSPIKPDVVLYEEGLDMNVMQKAVEAITAADVLIIGGTSLVVYPAAGLIDYYRGNKLVLVNRDSTARDGVADLIVKGSIGEIFSRLP